MVLGADLIATAGTEEQRKELLPGVAAGETRVAVAHMEDNGSWGADGITMVARADGGDLVLDGTKLFVVDGHTADTLIVAARTDPDSSGADGISVVVVDGSAEGVERTRLETMDMTRKQARVSFDGVRVPRSAVLGEAGSGWAALDETLTRAGVALAFEQVGGAQQCLDMSVDYAKVRVQFGRPIGSFQAVKHKCADMLCRSNRPSRRRTTPDGPPARTTMSCRSLPRSPRATAPRRTSSARRRTSRCTAASGSRGSTTPTSTSSGPRATS